MAWVVPESFAREIASREGLAGLAWIDALPDLIDRLLTQWSLVPSGAPMHGAVGIVVPVLRADGAAAVLKASFPHPGNLAEPKALATWAGRGAVRLLEHDAPAFATVLEKAGTHSLRDVPDPFEQMAIAGALNRRLAVPAPEGFPSLKAVADTWATEIESRQRRLSAPLADRLVGRAVETSRELSQHQPNSLVHGDLNFSNVLKADREPWLAIDPKGWVGDPAYDAVNLLRDRWHTLTEPLGDLLTAFAEAAELDRHQVIRWVQACAVKDTLWSIEFGESSLRAATNRAVADLD
ncbi:aminoglycoside phosphotransferase family protein [Kribbella sp. NPDC056861]|uniref:aminoglycoside phosphotransferase family protein n=1 Tax=Kribbella sp. NPDC056861 TaxID=3154857 RepID=UPI00343C96AF